MGSPVPHTVDAVPLGDFRGFASHDQAALKALLSFSYNATVGNMDEAFRAIKAVRRCVQGEGRSTQGPSSQHTNIRIFS